jgi:hypothetical protein
MLLRKTYLRKKIDILRQHVSLKNIFFNKDAYLLIRYEEWGGGGGRIVLMRIRIRLRIQHIF